MSLFPFHFLLVQLARIAGHAVHFVHLALAQVQAQVRASGRES